MSTRKKIQYVDHTNQSVSLLIDAAFYTTERFLRNLFLCVEAKYHRRLIASHSLAYSRTYSSWVQLGEARGLKKKTVMNSNLCIGYFYFTYFFFWYHFV